MVSPSFGLIILSGFSSTATFLAMAGGSAAAGRFLAGRLVKCATVN